MKQTFTLAFYLIITLLSQPLYAIELDTETQGAGNNVQKPLKTQVRPGWTIYVHGASTNYFQCINTVSGTNYDKLYNKGAMGAGIAINRSISHVFSLQAEYQYGLFPDEMMDGAYFNSMNLNGVVNLTSIWNDPTEFRFVQIYGKVGVGKNFLTVPETVEKPINESSNKYQGGIFADINISKNFAIRTGFTAEKLLDQYYKGDDSKAYNTETKANYWYWDFGLAYKFNFKKPAPASTPQQPKTTQLVQEELFGKRDIDVEMQFEPAIAPNSEHHVDLSFTPEDNHENGKFSFIPPASIMIFNEATGEYDQHPIEVSLEDLEKNADGSYTISFDILADKNLSIPITTLNASYSYDFKGTDNGVTFRTNSVVYPDWIFKIQIAAFTENEFKEEEIKSFFNLSVNPEVEVVDGLKRYLIGEFKKYTEAKQNAAEVTNNSYIHEAFVVGYKDGERITSLKGEYIPPRAR